MVLNRHILFIVLLGITLVESYAQSAQNEDVLVLDKSISNEFIGTYYYYYKDQDYALSIEDVSDPAFQKNFIKSTDKRSNFGNEQLAVWNKLTVTNPTDIHWLLDVSVYTIDTLVMYFPDGNGGFTEIIEGRSQPFKRKKYKSNSFAFDLDIPKGDTITLYLKVSAFIMQYPSQVHIEEDFIEKAHKRDVLTGLFLGIMMLVFFYNLFIWLATRDSNYLYYTLYVLFGAIFAFELNGLVSELLFVGPLQGFNTRGPFIVAIASISSIVFAVKFLETRKRVPRLNIILRYILIPALLFVCLLDFMDQKLLGSLLNQTIGMIAIFVMSAAAVFAYKDGLLSARYFLLAKFFYFTGVILFVLKTFAILPYTRFLNHAVESGLCLEMMFFSFALADKINQYKKEKERAIRKNQKLIEEQNVILEETVTQRTKDFFNEKEKSDRLLLNILPHDIAEELKSTGEVKAKVYDSVTILFSDFKDFTQISSGYKASELIQEINVYFKAFDSIVHDHQVEKIKTIGDAYMAAAGFASDSKTAIKQVVLCAIEMQTFVENRMLERKSKGLESFQMRLGIHTGPVVAGVVGDKKFQYDIWGDAVNTAARMESHGEVGEVNITETVYTMIADEPEFSFTKRQSVAVKGKGEMNMYFVRLNKPATS